MQGYSQPPAQRTGVEVYLGFFPMAFLLLFCAPIVEINGQPTKLSWGTHFFDLPPGRYHFRIYFSYMFMSQCGMNSRDVMLDPGAIRRVRFYMWPFIFAPGEMSVS